MDKQTQRLVVNVICITSITICLALTIACIVYRLTPQAAKLHWIASAAAVISAIAYPPNNTPKITYDGSKNLHRIMWFGLASLHVALALPLQ